MKLLCISDKRLCLTKGKIYEGRYVNFHGRKCLSVVDDDHDECIYDESNFEHIDE